MKPGRCPQRLSLRRHRHQSLYGFACLLVTASHPPAPMSDSSWGLFNLSIAWNNLTPLLTGTTLWQRSVSHSPPHHVSLSYDVFAAPKAFTVGSSGLRHTSLADKWWRWRENTASLFRTKCPSESWSVSARTTRSLVRRYHCFGGMCCHHLQGRSFIRNTGQCVTRQKTTVWIFVAVKIWNLIQGCTNPGHLVVVTSKFWTVAPNICGSSTRNLLHVRLLAPKTWRWLPRFWKVYAPLSWQQISSYQHCYTADKWG